MLTTMTCACGPVRRRKRAQEQMKGMSPEQMQQQAAQAQQHFSAQQNYTVSVGADQLHCWQR